MLLSSPIMFKFTISDKAYVNKSGRAMGREYIVVGHEERSSKFLFINDDNKVDAIEMHAITFAGFFDLKEGKMYANNAVTYDNTKNKGIPEILDELKSKEIPQGVKAAITTIQKYLSNEKETE